MCWEHEIVCIYHIGYRASKEFELERTWTTEVTASQERSQVSGASSSHSYRSRIQGFTSASGIGGNRPHVGSNFFPGRNFGTVKSNISDSRNRGTTTPRSSETPVEVRSAHRLSRYEIRRYEILFGVTL